MQTQNGNEVNGAKHSRSSSLIISILADERCPVPLASARSKHWDKVKALSYFVQLSQYGYETEHVDISTNLSLVTSFPRQKCDVVIRAKARWLSGPRASRFVLQTGHGLAASFPKQTMDNDTAVSSAKT